MVQKKNAFLNKIQTLVESDRFQNFIIIVITINSITLGMQTSDVLVEKIGLLLVIIDNIALGIFIIEIVLKLMVYGIRFFTGGWNLFDFFVVSIAVAPHLESLSVLRALRALRALRGLRLISAMPKMRQVAQALLEAIPGMFAIIAVISLLFYIGAVLATNMFGDYFNEWFGTLGSSLYTLFQLMTLESWSMGIVRPVMEVYPLSWIFFIPFIIITSFAALNMFIAVLVNSMQTEHESEQQVNIATAHAKVAALTEEMSAMRETDSTAGQQIIHSEFELLSKEVADLQRTEIAALCQITRQETEALSRKIDQLQQDVSKLHDIIRTQHKAHP